MLNTKYTQVIVEESGATGFVPPDFYFWVTEGIKDEKTGKMTTMRNSIYYQNGEFYDGEDSPPIKWQDVPEFFWRVVRESYSPEVIAREKLVFPENRKLTQEEHDEEVQARAESTFICKEPDCGEEVKYTDSGIHAMKHGRERVKARKEKAQLAQV